MNWTEPLHRSACSGTGRRPVGIGRRVLLVLLAVLLWVPAQAQSVIHVDTDAVGANDGTSWADAFVFLQDALAVAQDGDEIWVAEGVYRPDHGAGITPGDREASFDIPSGVSLYGGFAGGETDRDDRDWIANESVLSGDLLADDTGLPGLNNSTRLDNAFHVVRILTSSGPIRMDGLTIGGGMAVDGLPESGGAIDIRSGTGYPIRNPVTIANCRITDNTSLRGSVYSSVEAADSIPAVSVVDSRIEGNWANDGAGVYVGSSASVLIRGTAISGNTGGQAAGLYLDAASTVLMEGSRVSRNVSEVAGAIRVDTGETGGLFVWDSIVSENETLVWGAGGIYAYRGNLTAVNSIVSGNRTPDYGGAIFVADGTATIVNSVFAYNSAGSQNGALGTQRSNTRVSNSIFWANSAPTLPDLGSRRSPDTLQISHSFVQESLQSEVVDRGGNLIGDPGFANPAGADGIPGTEDDDFRLSAYSPAIDAGTNDSLLADHFDLDGDGDSMERWPTDIVAHQRVFDGGSSHAVVDMGAYEFGSVPVGLAPPNLIPETEWLPNPRTLVAYPNPSSGNFSIRWQGPTYRESRIALVDLNGRIVRWLYSGRLSPGDEIDIRVRDLRSGVYFMTEVLRGSTAVIALTF